MTPNDKIKISVYLDDTRIYTYEASAPTSSERAAKARDHIHAMGRNGLTIGPRDGALEYYPPHRISKIKVSGDFKESNYQGTWEGA
jgi:isopropylmalate/homocitrate/citramalate synthase